MKEIYDIFIKCVKNRDYESVAWILNHVDTKALYDLICKSNPTANDIDGSIVIWHTKNEFIGIHWYIIDGYIAISVRYSTDPNNPVTSISKHLYPKFKNVTVSIDKTSVISSFSISRCHLLGDHIYSKSPDASLDFIGDLLSVATIKTDKCKH